MRTLVVIPTYNERENIGSIVTRVIAVRQDVSVLIVDDNSPDGTGRLADELAGRHPGRVFVLHRAGKLGLGSAYLEGFRFGVDRGFDAVCEMDADGSHDPSALPALISAVERGADVAIGSRRVPGGKVVGWGPHRHFMSNAAMAFARALLGLRTRDVTAGFRCYRRPVVETLLGLDVRSNGYAFQEETIFHCERQGFRVVEVPIVFRDRTKGKSKLALPEIVQFFRSVFRLRKMTGKARFDKGRGNA